MNKSVKRNILILCLVILAMSASAGLRMDLSVDVPLYFGISSNDANLGQLSQFTFLFPEISLHYLFDLGPVKLGFGARMFTLILETITWPNIMAEVDLDPIVVSAQVGGGAYALFGLFSSSGTMPIIFSDLAVAGKLSDWFRLGVGVFAIGENDPVLSLSDEGVIPYAVYLFGKFLFNF